MRPSAPKIAAKLAVQESLSDAPPLTNARRDSSSHRFPSTVIHALVVRAPLVPPFRQKHSPSRLFQTPFMRPSSPSPFPPDGACAFPAASRSTTSVSGDGTGSASSAPGWQRHNAPWAFLLQKKQPSRLQHPCQSVVDRTTSPTTTPLHPTGAPTPFPSRPASFCGAPFEPPSALTESAEPQGTGKAPTRLQTASRSSTVAQSLLPDPPRRPEHA